MMTKQQVIDLMASSRNAEEWNKNCDKVKKAHAGFYPSYWYGEIVTSGLIDRVLGSGSSEIKTITGRLPKDFDL